MHGGVTPGVTPGVSLAERMIEGLIFEFIGLGASNSKIRELLVLAIKEKIDGHNIMQDKIVLILGYKTHYNKLARSVDYLKLYSPLRSIEEPERSDIIKEIIYLSYDKYFPFELASVVVNARGQRVIRRAPVEPDSVGELDNPLLNSE